MTEIILVENGIVKNRILSRTISDAQSLFPKLSAYEDNLRAYQIGDSFTPPVEEEEEEGGN